MSSPHRDRDDFKQFLLGAKNQKIGVVDESESIIRRSVDMTKFQFQKVREIAIKEDRPVAQVLRRIFEKGLQEEDKQVY